MNSGPHTVLIVDDHPAVRESLASRIFRSDDLDVAGEASSLPEALDIVEELKPDVAVIDIALKNDHGIDLIKKIKAKSPEVKMLVWSMYPDTLYAERALRAGAMGYLNKEQALSEILKAIRMVLGGDFYVSPDIARKLMNRSLGRSMNASAGPEDVLSDRELQVFELIGNGQATREIANQLHLSVNTVETHRQRIKSKLQIENSSELVQRATRWLMDRATQSHPEDDSV